MVGKRKHRGQECNYMKTVVDCGGTRYVIPETTKRVREEWIRERERGKESER